MDCQSFQILRHATSGRNTVQPATSSVANFAARYAESSLGVLLPSAFPTKALQDAAEDKNAEAAVVVAEVSPRPRVGF